MAREVYVAAVGLTKVDLTGRIFASVFDLFAEAYHRALEDSPVRAFEVVSYTGDDFNNPFTTTCGSESTTIQAVEDGPPGPGLQGNAFKVL
jgi:hypothetical protein